MFTQLEVFPLMKPMDKPRLKQLAVDLLAAALVVGTAALQRVAQKQAEAATAVNADNTTV